MLRIWYRPEERREYLERLEADGNVKLAQYFRLSLAEDKPDPILIACKRDYNLLLDGGKTDSALEVWRELVAVNHISEVYNRRVVELIKVAKTAEAIVAIEAF